MVFKEGLRVSARPLTIFNAGALENKGGFHILEMAGMIGLPCYFPCRMKSWVTLSIINNTVQIYYRIFLTALKCM
jgi:hypothetical protein